MSSWIYDIEASWADNLARGPHFDSPVPQRVLTPSDKWIDFLGFKVSIISVGCLRRRCSPPKLLQEQQQLPGCPHG
jgi:hypothetical protein